MATWLVKKTQKFKISRAEQSKRFINNSLEISARKNSHSNVMHLANILKIENHLSIRKVQDRVFLPVSFLSLEIMIIVCRNVKTVRYTYQLFLLPINSNNIRM